MMYRIDNEVYESLCSALMENDCDDSLQFDNWLNKNYTASELLASYESNGRKWYHNPASRRAGSRPGSHAAPSAAIRDSRACRWRSRAV